VSTPPPKNPFAISAGMYVCMYVSAEAYLPLMSFKYQHSL
jgi:hypothetical protein